MELDILRKNIKESLQDLMLKNDLNLVSFSREIKIEYKTLANYAQGVFAPNLKNAIKIVDFFGCSLDFLVGISDEEDFGNYSTPTLNFYEIHKKELKSQNITHYRLTKDTDINVNDVAKWKTGSIPTLYNLIKIADYLGVSIDSLIGREKIKE